MFKYTKRTINLDKVKQYCIEDIIACEERGSNILIHIRFTNEEDYLDQVEVAKYLPLKDKTIMENRQRAKQITIYSGVDLDRDKDWQAILQNITNRLANSEIRPSYLPQGNLDISGSPILAIAIDLKKEVTARSLASPLVK